METTKKPKPSPAAPAEVPEWKQWANKYLLDHKVRSDQIGGHTWCSCCGAAWLVKGGTKRGKWNLVYHGRTGWIPFRELFSDRWDDKEGLYLGENMTPEEVKKYMGMEKMETEQLILEDGNETHCIVWKVPS